ASIMFHFLAVFILCFTLSRSDYLFSNNAQCIREPSERFDCLPDFHNADIRQVKQKCAERNCCFQTSLDTNFPSCYYPINYTTYAVESQRIDGNRIKLQLSLRDSKPNWPPKQANSLAVTIDYINENVARVRIKSSKSSFVTKEILENPLPYKKNLNDGDRKYDILFDEENFAFSVVRRSTKAVIFNTSVSSLLFGLRFKQIATPVPSDHLYGFAEHNTKMYLKADKRKIYTFFNRGEQPEERNDPQFNLYGYHPFYLMLEQNGDAHGVFFHNTHALDVVVQPRPTLTYRTVGGDLDFFFFLGPKPDDVTSQYTSIVGRPLMLPYWTLGFHLCRYDYGSTNATRIAWKRTIDAGIPLDGQWNDIDYMENRKDFTYDPIRYKGLPEFVDELHKNDVKYIINISPGLSRMEPKGTYEPYETALQRKLFVVDPKTNEPIVGKVWQNETVWLDFTSSKTVEFWVEELAKFHSQIKFDALWLDMNEPYSFRSLQEMGCDANDPLEKLPYSPGGEPLSNSTLCMYAKHAAGNHFHVHTLYALYEAKATKKALEKVNPGKRPWILSRASVSGQGRYSSHWNGDITAEWTTMRRTISNMLTFNIIGMPFVGADICGFMKNTTRELCLRWQQLGSFYTFSRNHNDFDTIEHDPVAMGPEVVKATKSALILRYTLLPYLYTLFYKAHLFGTTVARPLFFEFPNDKETYEMDEQFMWGPAIMFNPALYEDEDYVQTYYPEGHWFANFKKTIVGPQTVFVKAYRDEPNVNFKSGHIIPTQDAGMTTTASRRNHFGLIVYIDPKTNEASGDLYWDDGENERLDYNHIVFKAQKLAYTGENGYELKTMPNITNYKSEKMLLGSVRILDFHQKP
ncbi:lysosomal alpha-glucosidase-like protein, partial [Dinothrombium tinctorium]